MSNQLPTTYKDLNKIQRGAFGELYARMAFILEGFEVYSPEYDDRGIDLVVRRPDKDFYTVQVKTTGITVNPWIRENRFYTTDRFLIVAIRLIEGKSPLIYAIKGSEWEKNDNRCLNHNGNGGKNGSYYEYSFAQKHAECLQKFAFNTYVPRLP